MTAGSAAGAVPKPLDDGSDLATPEGAVGDSLSVASWTLISRFTGVLRGITIAAVLGATYFANVYQFTNFLPNFVFYGLLAGSMFSSLLVPALIGHVDSGNRQAAPRTAGGLLGVAVLGMLAIVPVAAVATPWLLRLGSAGDPAAGSQAHVGALLVLLLLPQVPLYAIVGTATAVMNAHRRFALAAAAPALENLGTIAVLVVVTVLYTNVAAEHSVPLSLLLLLGLGTTGAVMLHASVQWWGARRIGIVLVPNAGWRDPQVRATIHRALPALAQAALAALQLGALLLAADRVAGGVVAFQLAINFYFLPIALAASPVALSLVPRLSRMTGPGQAGLFRDTYRRGLAFACFFAVPAATAYIVIARPIASAIGFGAFGAAGGSNLIAAALQGLAPAIVGETLFLITTYACYARMDTTRPLRGMIIQVAVDVGGLVAVAATVRGPALLTGLGLAFSAGSLVAAWYLVRSLRRELPHGGEPTLRLFRQTFICSAIMAVPAWAGAHFLASRLTGAPGRVATALLVSAGSAGIYFAAQAALRAPQMEWLTEALLLRWRRLARHATGARTGDWQRPRRRTPRLTGLAGLAARARAARPALRRWRLDAVLLLGIVAVGALAGIKIEYAVLATITIGLIGWVMARPAVAAYLLIFVTPLTVGLSAGSVVPLLRLNEALIVLLGAAIGLRWLAGLRSGDIRRPHMDRVDIALVALGVTSSVLPLAMMAVRQRPISTDDLLYCLVLWKLLAEYVIVRSVVSTREQAMRCLVLSMAAAAIVGVIGIMQSLGLAGVPGLLATYTSSPGADGMVSIARGSSLLGLPAATADLVILNLGIAVAMIVRGHPRRLWLAGLAVVYVLSVIAAAEFATLIGLVVALIALVAITRSGRIAVYVIPVALFGGLLLWPVIQLRLSDFHSTAGLPLSWIDRLYNLRTFFWPVLFSDYNWILGVRPSARVAAPGVQGGFIWIESGYTWLLWGGGIPLLGSYIAFAAAVIRKGWAYGRRADAAGIAATAVTAAMCSQVVIMAFDPHLTFRGSGDALFLLLALIRRLSTRQTSPVSVSRPAAAAVAQPLGVLV